MKAVAKMHMLHLRAQMDRWQSMASGTSNVGKQKTVSINGIEGRKVKKRKILDHVPKQVPTQTGKKRKSNTYGKKPGSTKTQKNWPR